MIEIEDIQLPDGNVEKKYVFNEYQSEFSKENIEAHFKNIIGTKEIYGKEDISWVHTQIANDLHSIIYLQNLTSPNRRYVEDMPKDKYGKVIVDFANPHILQNMDYFRPLANKFKEIGKYTDIKRSKHPMSKYVRFWKDQIIQSLSNMVREDGEWIPGDLYWYWNFATIYQTKLKEGSKKRGSRIRIAPKTFDGDYLWFHYKERCKEEGQHGSCLKARGKGFSIKESNDLAKNFILGADLETLKGGDATKSYALAESDEFLVKDGILNKFVDTIDWCSKSTEFPKIRRIKDSLSDKHWIMGYKDKQNKTVGSQNEVMGVTLKNDPQKARGKRGNIKWEEVGAMTHFLTSWTIARPSVEDGGVAFAFMVAFGTGGEEMKDFMGLYTAFYEPGPLNIYGIPNVFDRKSSGDKKVGFFFGEYMNRFGCFDENGNSDIIKALIEIYIQRWVVKKASNPNLYIQEKAERPCISKNTIVSNTSIGSNKITLFDKHFINGNHELFELKTKDGRKLECTYDHEIYNGTEYKEAGRYNIGEKIKLKEFVPNKDYVEVPIQGALNFQKYNIKIDEDFAKMLGLYMGDGCFYNESIEFSFDERDVESIDWLVNYFTKTFKTPVIKSCDSKMKKVFLHSKELKEIFKQLDLIKKWNDNKHGYKRKIHVPLYIFQSPKSVIASFLQGFFDSDGSIYKSLKNIRVYAKEKNILEEVQILLSSFGIFCQIKSAKKINGEGRVYTGNTITLRSWEVDLFKEIGFISKRKQELLNEWTKYKSSVSDKNYGYDTIISFDSIGVQEVYDIQTEEGCYSANGIWAHNCTPQEAVMRKEGSIFPINDLRVYLENDISPDLNKFVSPHYVGELEKSLSGELKWKNNTDKNVIRQYPTPSSINREGCVEIFVQPQKDSSGKIPWGRYIGGIDPYDDDTGTSLGSIFIFDLWTDKIVAEYSGRPKTANEFYEICLRLAEFYNANCNYENNKKGLFTYFSNKNALRYLCDTPQILRDTEYVKGVLQGNKLKGTNATQGINKYARRLLADWMVKSRSINTENSEGQDEELLILNLHTIRSVGLIQEALVWNEEDNFDRISAMGMLMILRESLIKITESNMNYDDMNESDLLFDPFFTGNYTQDYIEKSFRLSSKLFGDNFDKSIVSNKTSNIDVIDI